ncbi:MAG: dihydroorotate dehydrogenase electron transfer subunit [Prevotellaceae bacterium]|nr:dihydroorotate dehydrogenase electron transfer subunit [Prevotellaceae bacterium]
MKKKVVDLKVVSNEAVGKHYTLLRLTDPVSPLPEARAGQFAQLRVDNSPATFLRRPISIHFLDRKRNEVLFLVRLAGEGTRHLAALSKGDTLNALMPLGNGFSIPRESKRVLLAGGGAGVAPLLFLGAGLRETGCEPVFLLGAKSRGDLLPEGVFGKFGKVYITTEDGSAGERGFATQHSVLRSQEFERIYCCGPKPMMMAVAKYATTKGIPCEVSLENTMACGLGACLCCVEDTRRGNVCVCTEGPVFDIKELKWQI